MANGVNISEILDSFMKKAKDDHRLGPVHISLFLAIVMLGSGILDQEIIYVQKYVFMNAAKIHSPTTFHKIIHQLDEYGYIQYSPTNNKWENGFLVLK